MKKRTRDIVVQKPEEPIDYLAGAVWNKRFMRNIEIMKGVAHGVISPTSKLARRTIGRTYEEFIANLYMPEELLRNRNKHERERYDNDADRTPGSGEVEAFREFVLNLLRKQDVGFHQFHDAVCGCSKVQTRKVFDVCTSEEVKKWLLKFYL